MSEAAANAIARRMGELTEDETAEVLDIALTNCPEGRAYEVIRRHYPDLFPEEEE